jgi:tetratricopeptide (TPR) repeat protein
MRSLACKAVSVGAGSLSNFEHSERRLNRIVGPLAICSEERTLRLSKAKLSFGVQFCRAGSFQYPHHAVFAVDGSQRNPDDLFEQAQSAEGARDIAQAKRLYRILMKTDPTDASAPFNLGNMLRADGRNVEAEAALWVAIRVDRYSLTLRTILATRWTSSDAPKPPLSADAMFNLAPVICGFCVLAFSLHQ